MSGKVTVKIENAYCHKQAEPVATKTGKAMARFSVSTSDDKKIDGRWERGPSKWWNCVAFDANAEKAISLLTGSVRGVTVEGRLSLEEYEGKVYEKIIVDHLEVAVPQGTPSKHEASKVNGYAPEPQAEEEADIPF